jgi:hypothetical protein
MADKRRQALSGPVHAIAGPGPCDRGANNQLSDTQVLFSEKYAKRAELGGAI